MSKKIIALLIVVCLIVSITPPLAVFADAEAEDVLADVVEEPFVDDEANEYASVIETDSSSDVPLYLNLGDSIAWGRIEDEQNFPGYNYDRDSYSGRLAAYLGTTRTNYARRGMQTTDVLYMIDEQFQKAVDSGLIKPDTWSETEYPPDDGTPLEQVRNDIANADYITLCVGICDFMSYPDSVHSEALEKLKDPVEAKNALKEYFANGKIDLEVFNALSEIIKYNSDKAAVTLKFIFDILDGFEDYLKYYPRIVKDIKCANPDVTLILIGTYLTGSKFSFLIETEEGNVVLSFINRLLDNIDFVVKNAAINYDCVYVDTMGIESKWHPTVLGHEQIFNRIVSVLQGKPTYSGSTRLPTAAVKLIKKSIVKQSSLFKAFTEKVVFKPATAVFNLLQSILKIRIK